MALNDCNTVIRALMREYIELMDSVYNIGYKIHSVSSLFFYYMEYILALGGGCTIRVGPWWYRGGNEIEDISVLLCQVEYDLVNSTVTGEMFNLRTYSIIPWFHFRDQATWIRVRYGVGEGVEPWHDLSPSLLPPVPLLQRTPSYMTFGRHDYILLLLRLPLLSLLSLCFLACSSCFTSPVSFVFVVSLSFAFPGSIIFAVAFITLSFLEIFGKIFLFVY